MATQQELREAQKKVREATKKRIESAARSDLSDRRKDIIELDELIAKEDAKGVRLDLAAQNRAARDRRSQVARNLRN